MLQALKKVKSAKSVKDIHERKSMVLVSDLKEKMKFSMPGAPEKQIEEQPVFSLPSKSPKAQSPVVKKEDAFDEDIFDLSKLGEQRKKDALHAQSTNTGQWIECHMFRLTAALRVGFRPLVLSLEFMDFQLCLC